jgi:predicted house-cleaning noncanonical NTP pyrophosphatase (MazG superfamily)
MLNKKLLEEVNEYLESGDSEELADILEVVRGISKAKGITFDEILNIMDRKHAKRGGFDNKVFLIETTKEKSL